MLKSSLYLHIPFCTSKCGYCAFNSLTNQEHLIQDYMQILLRFLQHKFEILKKSYQNLQITSIYIGGGTPSVVDSKHYEGIFKTIEPFLLKGAEITIEANPNSLNLAWLRDLQSFGVNRLSIGAQSFFKQKLAFLEREHSDKNIFNALNLAQKSGIKNLSIDLIYGTPLCDEKLLKKELQIATTLPISHISAYELSIEKGSRFYKNKVTKDSNAEFLGFASMGHFVKAQLADFKQYEVSNFGLISKHNLNYWNGGNYIGIGAGAFGSIEGVRYFMPLNIKTFMQKFSEEKEYLSADDKALERLFLGFRSCVGVAEDEIKNKDKLEILLQENKVFSKNGRIFTNDYFLGDEIALYLL